MRKLAPRLTCSALTYILPEADTARSALMSHGPPQEVQAKPPAARR